MPLHPPVSHQPFTPLNQVDEHFLCARHWGPPSAHSQTSEPECGGFLEEGSQAQGAGVQSPGRCLPSGVVDVHQDPGTPQSVRLHFGSPRRPRPEDASAALRSLTPGAEERGGVGLPGASVLVRVACGVGRGCRAGEVSRRPGGPQALVPGLGWVQGWGSHI